MECMIKNKLFSITILMSGLFLCPGIYADDDQSEYLLSLSMEELLNIEVTTVSRTS